MEKLKIGIFPGSFDPITVGHEFIILKAAKLVDSLVIGIGSNSNKKHQFDVAIREEWVKKTFDSHQNILVKKYDGLTVDFAKKENASFIFRGLRSTIDFEYEKQIAETNSMMNKEIETIFLLASNKYGMISSSIVRQIFINNGDINSLIPNAVNIPINE
jgi:pantetheine-phosphate adenylyltransferase